MAKNEAIIVGWIRKNKLANCGETMKNQLLIKKLEELGVKCRQMDFKGWKRRPWIIFQLIWNICMHRDDTLIFSTSAANVYPLMKLMKRVNWKQNTIHWVIGGSLGQKCKHGIYSPEIIGYMKHTIVESNLMVDELNQCGVQNVKMLPNFKPIDYYPSVSDKGKGEPVRFVFLSRIMPEKGCDYILEAARLLNEEGLQDQFIIDFYGAESSSYKRVFEDKVSELPNVHYEGFLNLREPAGYDMLASYDMMLFPTYWKGEGFAGIFIDAFISGVPLIASDWMHNRQFLTEGKTALFIPVHNVIALCDKMRECILGQYDFQQMAMNCQKEAEKYNVNNVITTKLLQEIEIL